jgi:hypothetical protein
VYPELKERTIKEGDIFAIVCGEKEPKGYIHVMGLGSTSQEVGTPGLKCYSPTRLQLEIFARMKAESDKAALEQWLLELQTQMNQKAQQGISSEEPMSQHDSTLHQPLVQYSFIFHTKSNIYPLIIIEMFDVELKVG